MKSLIEFANQLNEEKNVHMEHIEDLVFNEGVEGTRRAINFLRDLRDMLAGNSKSKVTTTVKWDGAPAIFAGIDPRDGKFFVAKKGVFNKNPKVYKTDNEIDSDVQGDLATKLKIALHEFKKLGIKSGVYQGDLMFTKNDLKTEIIDGVKYLTFHPNTIVYAVPHNSDLAKKIRQATIGVVWHTTYVGHTFDTMRAAFGKSITGQLHQVNSVWMDDATYKDYSGTVTFTDSETKQITEMLSAIGSLFKQTPAETLNAISKDPEMLLLVKTYNNSKVREGVTTTPGEHVEGLFKWIYDKLDKEVSEKKTEKGKAAAEQKKQRIVGFFAKHDKADIVKVFQLSAMIADVKLPIINKMNRASEINTFVRTPTGFKVTGVEGYVAIDHIRDNAVKIVDRMEFSKNNFSSEIVKGWQR